MFSSSTVFSRPASDGWCLPSGQGIAKVGAYLLQGRVTGHQRAFSATLLFSLLDGEEVSVEVLVSRRGNILEMINLPPGVRAAKWQTDSQANLDLNIVFSIRRISWIEYRARQLRRVLPIFWTQTSQRRTRLGLTVGAVLLDLNYAYSMACRFRSNAYQRNYTEWHKEFYTLSPTDRQQMTKRLKTWSSLPYFDVMIIRDPQDTSQGTQIDAQLDAQTYPHFSRSYLSSSKWADELAKRSEAVQSSGSRFSSRWTIVLTPGTQLSDSALYWLADKITQDKSDAVAVVYTDHDTINDKGSLTDPDFKPDWSPELLRATNYIGDAFAWRTRPLSSIWDPVQAQSYSIEGALHSLLLSLTSDSNAIAHVSAPLWHHNISHDVIDQTRGVESAHVVGAHLKRQGIDAVVDSDGEGRCHVRYGLPLTAPMVSIIIPTRDGLSHLKCCIESLLVKTDYPLYEVIVIDNQSVYPETLAYFQEITTRSNVRVLPFNEAFNYSKINNYAVEHAHGELICLLNNDTEIISSDWLIEMVGIVSQPGVGAVGAKLLYGNDTVQHAGDTVGPGGCANHLHSGIGRDDPGYRGRALVSQDLSAVTAACLLTSKSLYKSLGGLDEVNLSVAFNDVDFCLRIRESGQRIVWTPHALLYHHESISRGKDVSPVQIARATAEVTYMRKRWAHLMDHDPFYNPNLNYQHPDFQLSHTPNVAKPWA